MPTMSSHAALAALVEMNRTVKANLLAIIAAVELTAPAKATAQHQSNAMRADNTETLRAAALRRSDETLTRASNTIEKLAAAGEAVTVTLVARHAGVSRSWLYIVPSYSKTLAISAVNNQQYERVAVRQHRNWPAPRHYNDALNLPTRAYTKSPKRTGAYNTSWPAHAANAANATR
jgi:DNA invertase Pin-like site-specific DNA recombinase